MTHIPVMAEEVLQFASQDEFKPKKYLDCTFGRGGHLQLLWAKFPEMKAVVLDRDPQAIEYAKQTFGKEISKGQLQVIHGNFHHINDISSEQLSADEKFDLILADLGVSSPQLDQAERGFSFYHDGPLDMRMDTTKGLRASDIVNEWDEDDLVELFKTLGEIFKPYRVVQKIIEQRSHKPFTRTSELADLIENSMGWRQRGVHPATNYFMALRLKVNEELSELESAIHQLVQRLAPQGRLLLITFHSLEDRICKYAMRAELEHGTLMNKKVIQPSRTEVLKNVRSRSAKLRGFTRSETT